MNIVAIIPARAGSKGILNKNLIDFCTKPLLVWSVLQAIESERVNSVYVTSDDEQILKTAQHFGAHPIKRPPELATDIATSESALLHALDEIRQAEGKDPDLVVFLQATSPLRESADIDGAIERLMTTAADSLFSYAALEDFCIWKKEAGKLKGLSYDPLNRGRRQDRESLLLENGSLYVFKPSILREHNNRLGGRVEAFEMSFWKSYEIDSPQDIELCSYYFRTKLLAKSGSRLHPKKLQLIVYDFDGVMTNNKVLVLQDGTEAIVADRADGLGINMIRSLGIEQIILSTEANPVVQARANKLGIPVIQNCKNKHENLQDYCATKNIALSDIAFVGNDLNDFECMKRVGFPIAPHDAHPSIKELAILITRAEGGNGVIKELAEHLSYCQTEE